MQPELCVIGAGLAGCEAAWQLAIRGLNVRLYEMKPKKMTPAQSYNGFAELVCSNSLKSDLISNASGLLKEEMRRFDSLIVRAADETRVPAGSALAVNRNAFSDAVTQAIRENPHIEIYEEEIVKIPETGNVIIATGPLTTETLGEGIREAIGGAYLHFYDAAAPIISAESIDMEKAFFAARYQKGDETDYINCPLDESEYEAFHAALVGAECAELKGFEDNSVFEGCMPIEVMAGRGRDTIRYGPMRPVGMIDPRTGKRPYAVVQLRKENEAGTLYNLVGFQTHLKFPEQKRVFSMIPGLQNMEILRYGVMHRNTYIQSPKVLDGFCRLKADSRISFAGQMTGVEGYMESAASGLMAGIFAAADIKALEKPVFTGRTVMGALLRYVTQGSTADFQPMNANFGIVDELETRIKNKTEKALAKSRRALEEIEQMKNQYQVLEVGHV